MPRLWHSMLHDWLRIQVTRKCCQWGGITLCRCYQCCCCCQVLTPARLQPCACTPPLGRNLFPCVHQTCCQWLGGQVWVLFNCSSRGLPTKLIHPPPSTSLEEAGIAVAAICATLFLTGKEEIPFFKNAVLLCQAPGQSAMSLTLSSASAVLAAGSNQEAAGCLRQKVLVPGRGGAVCMCALPQLPAPGASVFPTRETNSPFLTCCQGCLTRQPPGAPNLLHPIFFLPGDPFPFPLGY